MQIQPYSLNYCGRLFESIGSTAFPNEIIDGLSEFVEFDGSCMILFHPSYPPSVQSLNVPPRDEEVFWGRYMSGTYRHDPYFRLCNARKHGIYRIEQVAPVNFLESEYYQAYFGPAQIHDEIDIIFQGPAEISGLISLSRERDSDPFSIGDENALASLLDVTLRALTAHLRLASNLFEAKHELSRGTNIRKQLVEFSRDSLTGREHEIIQLMIAGNSSKEIARSLDISPETERTHRKNIYRKLAINSHLDLLPRVIDFLESKEL